MRLFELIARDPRFEIVTFIERYPLQSLKRDRPNSGGRPIIADAIQRLIRFCDERAPGVRCVPSNPVFPAFASIEHITLHRYSGEESECLPHEEVDRILSMRIDVLIWYASCELRGALADTARYGVWSILEAARPYANGVESGYWETARAEPVTAVTLQVHGPEVGRERVIGRAWFSTHSNAVKNRRKILEGSVSLIRRELCRLVREGRMLEVASGEVTTLPNTAPSLGQSMNYARRRMVNVASGKWQTLLTRLGMRPRMWTLAIGKGTLERGALSQTKVVTPPANHFWADPFLISRAGSLYVFFEDFDYVRAKGVIGLARIEGDTVEPLGTVLDAGYHMSFPFVFEHADSIYMIPETCSRHRVEVWRATRFPFEWQLHATGLEEQDVGDALLHQHNGQWWLFANIAQTPDADLCNELHLFAVDGPDLHSIAAHPLNPVVLDSRRARNAGRPFYRNGQLYRPSQSNAFNVYGYGLNLMRITSLDEESYDEELVETTTPGFKPGLVGVHHVDWHGDVFVIDICYRIGGWGQRAPVHSSKFGKVPLA
jgi:hypothetical protein